MLTKRDFFPLDEVGPETAESIAAFFKQDKNIRVIEKLKAAGVHYPVERKKEGRLSGKSFLFTGGLHEFTRNEASGFIQAEGGKMVSSCK